jgi:hypothetical protein
MGQSQACFKGAQKGLAAPIKEKVVVAAPHNSEDDVGSMSTSAPHKSDDSSSYGSAPIAELGPDGLPSKGSALHFSRECKRCAFFWKGRCQKGHSCEFCHFEHEVPSKGAKKKQPNGKDAHTVDKQAVLSTVPAPMSSNQVNHILLQSAPQQSAAQLEAQQIYWQQQQWGGPVQQWPYTESFSYDDYMYPYAYDFSVTAAATKDEQDSARASILAMVGAWDALTMPMSDSNIIPEDPGVDTPPLSRGDLLRFKNLAAAQKETSPSLAQEQPVIRAVKVMEEGSPEKFAGRVGMRKGKGRTAASLGA